MERTVLMPYWRSEGSSPGPRIGIKSWCRMATAARRAARRRRAMSRSAKQYSTSKFVPRAQTWISSQQRHHGVVEVALVIAVALRHGCAEAGRSGVVSTDDVGLGIARGASFPACAALHRSVKWTSADSRQCSRACARAHSPCGVHGSGNIDKTWTSVQHLATIGRIQRQVSEYYSKHVPGSFARALFE